MDEADAGGGEVEMFRCPAVGHRVGEEDVGVESPCVQTDGFGVDGGGHGGKCSMRVRTWRSMGGRVNR